MGLTFTVGTSDAVFSRPFAAQVQVVLQAQFAISLPTALTHSPPGESYFSEEVAWSGWRELQESALHLLGFQHIPHLLAVEAWQGVYLPSDIKPKRLKIDHEPTPLQCAGLFALIDELTQYAQAASLPIGTDGLQQLWNKYAENDDLADADMHIQTYIQVMLAARIAVRHHLPLWIVK